MKIPRDSCPPDFFDRPHDFAKILFLAKIDKWSQVNAALGTLEKTLGDLDDVNVAMDAILHENAIDYSDFSQEVEDCLPELPFSIPAEEFGKRRDFRKECVFTVDPLTARYLILYMFP